MTTTPLPTLRAVTSIEEFKGLASEWNRLLDDIPHHSLFLTWEWLYHWALHYLGHHRLHILLAFDRRRQLIGILPFYIHLVRTLRVIPIRELRFLGGEQVGASYLDVIAEQGRKPAVLAAFYRYLMQEARSEWDSLLLADLAADSSTVDLLNACFDEAGKVAAITRTTACPIVRLPTDIDTYRAALGRSRRYSIRRKRTRLHHEGNVAFTTAAVPTEIDGAFASFIRLHQQRWGTTSTGGVFASDAARRFHRDIVQALGARGYVRIDMLWLNDRPIAGIYGFIYRGVYYFYLPGFDPTALPEAGVGILLLSHRIEQTIRDGVRTVDLLQGTSAYKLAWSTDLRRLMTVRYYNRSLRAAVGVALEQAKRLVKIVIR